MSGPVRIQLRRTKGWKMPPNTVKVDRTTRWGNRWAVADVATILELPPERAAAVAVTIFANALEDGNTAVGFTRAEVREALRDKNLGCWCRLCPDHAHGKPFTVHCTACAPCHADPLGEMANDTPSNVKEGDDG